MAPTDGIVKDVADEDPWYVVERRRRGQVARAPKDDREIEVPEHIQSELFV